MSLGVAQTGLSSNSSFLLDLLGESQVALEDFQSLLPHFRHQGERPEGRNAVFVLASEG